MPPTYVVGDELPSLLVVWKDTDGDVIDFSGSFTWSLRLARGGVTALTKTTAISGGATSPNVTVDWAVGELSGLVQGVYAAQLTATRTADSKDRTFSFSVQMLAAIPAS